MPPGDLAETWFPGSLFTLSRSFSLLANFPVCLDRK